MDAGWRGSCAVKANEYLETTQDQTKMLLRGSEKLIELVASLELYLKVYFHLFGRQTGKKDAYMRLNCKY